MFDGKWQTAPDQCSKPNQRSKELTWILVMYKQCSDSLVILNDDIFQRIEAKATIVNDKNP